MPFSYTGTMSQPKVCARFVLLLVMGCCLTLQPAFAQEKFFQITNDGLFYFYNDESVAQNKMVEGKNDYTRPITARTFFLEAKKEKVFPESMNFNVFQKMTTEQQQHLLDSLQGEYDWSKFKVDLTEKFDSTQINMDADTVFTAQNLAFSKETQTLYGDLVSGMGRKQRFMVYPIISKSNIHWVFEWQEMDPYQKKKGYKNLHLPEQKIYECLWRKGIDGNVLNGLLEEK